jgi:hypothetical protein
MSNLIIAGIRQFGLAPDGADLRDLEATIERLTKERDLANERLDLELDEYAKDAHRAKDKATIEWLTRERDWQAKEAATAWDTCEERRLEGHAWFLELTKVREALEKIANNEFAEHEYADLRDAMDFARAALSAKPDEPQP